MKNITILLLLLACSFSSYGQAILFSDEFEDPITGWSFDGNNTANSWIQANCALNGPTTAGVRSIYISRGGTTMDCTPTGIETYAYNSSAAAVENAIIYRTVDATCASGVTLNFDYSIGVNDANDFGRVVYSLDNGVTWLNLPNLAVSPTFTASSVTLPATVNGTTFLLGFEFVYDNTTENNPPLAIDNISVEGTDLINPTLTCSSSSIALFTGLNCEVTIPDLTKDFYTLSDNCTDSADIVVTQLPIEGTVIPSSAGANISVTLTAQDQAGNTSSCDLTILVTDGQNPTISCAADSNIYVDASCNALVPDLTPTVTVNDNCTSLANLTVTQDIATGTSVNGTGTTTLITLTVTDESMNTATCTMNTVNVDTISPTLTCPGPQNLYADASCNDAILDYLGFVLVNDNCSSSFTLTQAPLNGVVIERDTVVIITANDGNGNTSTCNFEVLLLDTIKPTIVCNGNNQQGTQPGLCDTLIADYISTVAWSDNCSTMPTFTQTPAAGTAISGTTTGTITITDESGNFQSCTFTVEVIDTENPVPVCPPLQELPTDASCTAVIPDYLSLASATDNCSSLANITLSQNEIGTTINGYAALTTVTISATDEIGNIGTCDFIVRTVDTTAPNITTCVPAQTVGTNSLCLYEVEDFSSQADANDNCDPSTSLVYSQSPAAGTNLPVGVQNVTAYFTDLSGNVDSCIFVLTVEDNINPTINVCATSQNVIVDANCAGTLGDYTSLVDASDNCSASTDLVITQSPLAGTAIIANTVVTLTVTDENNNATTCTLTAVLVDNIAPSITCSGNIIVSGDATCSYLVPDVTGSSVVSDNCTETSNLVLTQSPTASSASGGLTVVTVTVTDENGNTASCEVNVTVDDITPATITCPANATINNGPDCDYSITDYTMAAVVNDDCPNYTVTQSPAPGDIINPGTNTITLTVSDAGANETSCTFELKVEENVSPNITCPGNISTCDPLVVYADPVGTDNCNLFLIEQNDLTGFTSGDIFPVGNTLQKYIITDSSGNQNACSFFVEVLEYPSEALILNTETGLCDVSNVVLEANPLVSGTGLWIVETGNGNLNNQFATTTGANNLSDGINTFIWSVTSPTCGSTADTIEIEVSQAPFPASTQDTVFNCNSNTVQLTGNVPNIGTGLWYTNSTATFDDATSPIVMAENLNVGWTEIIWSITNGACPTSTDTTHVFSGQDAFITTTKDTTLCVTSAGFPLTATSPTPGTNSTWFFIEGAGLIQNKFDPSTFVSDFAAGSNTIIFRSENPNCGVSTDTIKVQVNLCGDFNPVIPTMITPNLDGRNDLFVIENLALIYPECTVTIINRWGNKVFESTGYEEPWDGTFKGNQVPMGTYFYEIKLNNSESTTLKGSISVVR